jgi:hypothetical protein
MVRNYPVEILPRKEYELNLDIPSMLKAYLDLYVSRRIDGVKEELDGDYVLQDKVLEKIGVANFFG